MARRRYSEARLLEEHNKAGRKRFGKKRWEGANIGWGQEDKGICSKVYGNPCYTFQTTYEDGRYIHDEDLY